ncbi:geranylgeranylglyceryl/heptaprenylglyceryl phosphate synthase [Flaviramulus sp. BrNp1-15]|uniref:geranylgeranylglyceryl/heptaprenylglyceryl phosphate synthase n=1 Tax=Flaviramulus sp. BrNp1-15 TaxID=2916754 RepID=UPI001EE7AB2F|nr:geranylgeranylglyceryl/heptaprenylglyceryl phosphate synthase [Flaviramulus sp. BrNp1-15]ULC60002.1 geranylgeranylglyceryl/heptaprenylglyceryl phosphate synthase [Flaviramulus sp. BrNp1-15]
MKEVYNNILEAILNNKKLLAILIDPDKFSVDNTASFIKKVNMSVATHIFVGGSTVEEHVTEIVVSEIKKHTYLPVVLFPGDVSQITKEADALLFLSLISGRNPEYLIGKHVEAVSKLKKTNLETIPTGYVLIENEKKTAIEEVSKTTPMSRTNIQKIVDTVIAGELLGMKLMYLEAGSGAKESLNQEIISSVKKELKIPLIVGGGIRSKSELENAYKSGADMVVVGTVLEEDESFFDNLQM